MLGPLLGRILKAILTRIVSRPLDASKNLRRCRSAAVVLLLPVPIEDHGPHAASGGIRGAQKAVLTMLLTRWFNTTSN